MITPKRNIEVGKTVIVEKKRYKRGPSQEIQSQKSNINETNIDENKSLNINETNTNENKNSMTMIYNDNSNAIDNSDDRNDLKNKVLERRQEWEGLDDPLDRETIRKHHEERGAIGA